MTRPVSPPEACPHDDDPQLCPPCQGGPVPRIDRWRRVPRTFPIEAAYSGRCDAGDDRVEIGDPLVLEENDAGDTRWVHETCSEDADD